MNNSRREFIRKTSIASLGFWGLSQCALSGCKINMAPNVGFGPLQHREGEILSLPEGFSAKVISKKGTMMNDGVYVPGSHDGMGIFNWKNGKILLIRNHELLPGSWEM